MSDDAFCLALMRRALLRDDLELRGFRAVYDARARMLAARLIAGVTTA